MIHAITTKLEIDIMQGTELTDALEMAFIHLMPSVVVHPDLVTDAVIQRTVKQGRFKIIVPVDWPKGDKKGVFKFQGMQVDALSQDGFEILVSASTNRSLIKDELKQIDSFIKDHMPPTTEIRVVIGVLNRDPEVWETICDVLKEVPAPTLIRTDHTLRIQQAKANTQVHCDTIEAIKRHTKRPIKISGNISSLKVLATCPANKYAVNLKQAQGIIAELRKDPDKARKIFEPTAAIE